MEDKKEIYNGKYIVSRDGKVWSVNLGRFLKLHNVNGGSLVVQLRDENGNRHKTRVHRLVAELFIPNPDNKPQVDHINGDRHDNCVCNLRWCTNSENQSFRDMQGNSGGKSKGKAVMYGDDKFTSISALARHIAEERGSKTETVRKEIKKLSYGKAKIYGKISYII